MSPMMIRRRSGRRLTPHLGRGGRPLRSWSRFTGLVRRAEAGMTTAEYAVGTLAAVAFAAVLLAVVKSGPVKAALASVITSALQSR